MPDSSPASAEDIPQSVVEAGVGQCSWRSLTALKLSRKIIAAALREYERLGYRLIRDDDPAVERITDVIFDVERTRAALAEYDALTAAQGGEDG